MPEATTSSGTEIQQAARLLAEGRVQQAIELLEHLVADFPAYVSGYVLLARAYESAGRLEEGLRAWHRAYFLMPRSPLVGRQRKRLLERVGGPAIDMAPPAAPAPPRPRDAPHASEEGDARPVAEEAGPDVEHPVDRPARATDERWGDEPSDTEQPPLAVEELRTFDEGLQVGEPPAPDQSSLLEQPGDHEQPGIYEEPRALDETGALEEPSVHEQPPAAEEPPPTAETRDLHRPVDPEGAGVLDEPHAWDEAAPIEEPPGSEEPRSAEEPHSFEQPSIYDEASGVGEPPFPERPAQQFDVSDEPHLEDDPHEATRPGAPAAFEQAHEIEEPSAPDELGPAEASAQDWPQDRQDAAMPPTPDRHEPPHEDLPEEAADRRREPASELPHRDSEPEGGPPPTDFPEYHTQEDAGWRLLAETERPRPPEEPVEPEIAPPISQRAGPRSETPDEPSAPAPEPTQQPEDAAPPPTGSPDEWVDIDAGLGGQRPRQDDQFLREAADLDSLIEQLENAPRIQPEDRRGAAGEAELEDEVVTETLARIYEGQQQFAAAARAYERLADEQPKRAEEFRRRASELRQRSRG